MITWSAPDLMTTATKVREHALALKKGGANVVVAVDEVGLGGGVHDWLKKAGGFRVQGFNSSRTANDHTRYANTRSEAFLAPPRRARASEDRASA